MAVKVVEGLIGKPELEQRVNQNNQAVKPAGSPAFNANSVSIQQSISKAIVNSDAVVSSVRALRVQGISEPIKDAKVAQKTASDVAEKIRDDKDGEAAEAHDGLSSSKSSPVLVN